MLKFGIFTTCFKALLEELGSACYNRIFAKALFGKILELEHLRSENVENTTFKAPKELNFRNSARRATSEKEMEKSASHYVFYLR